MEGTKYLAGFARINRPRLRLITGHVWFFTRLHFNDRFDFSTCHDYDHCKPWYFVEVGGIRLPGSGIRIFLAIWDLSGGIQIFWSMIRISKKFRVPFRIQILFWIRFPVLSKKIEKFNNFVSS